MAQRDIKIKIVAEDDASQQLKNVEDASKRASVGLDDMKRRAESSGMAMSLLAAASAAALSQFGGLVKSTVNAAMQFEQASMSLAIFAAKTGQSGDMATQTAQQFVEASGGLISFTESAQILSNLMASGMHISDANQLMKQMLGTALLSKENLEDTFGQALIKSSQGIRILQERQIDAIGINMNAQQVIEKYGATLNLTADKMSTAQKQQALINEVMRQSTGNASALGIVSDTLSGQIGSMRTSIQSAANAIGQSLTPAIGTAVSILQPAVNAIKNFSEKFPVLSSSIIIATGSFLILLTALTTFGALSNIVKTGLSGITAMIGMLIPKLAITNALTIKSTLIVLAVAAALVGLVALVAKLSGKYDNFKTSLQKVTDGFKNFSGANLDAGSSSQKTAKELAKEQKQIESLAKQLNSTVRTFKEGMRDWVTDHDDKTAEISVSIEDLRKKYTKEVDAINNAFTTDNEDAVIAHQRKTDDIIADIEKEKKRGIWADQDKLKEYQKNLDEENYDFNRNQEKKRLKRDQELSDKKEEYNKDLAELQKKLDIELRYEQQYGKLIAEARTWPMLDEIQKMERQYTESLTDIKNQLQEIGDSTVAASSSINQGFSSSLTATTQQNKVAVDTIKKDWYDAGEDIRNKLQNIWKQVKEDTPTILGGISEDVSANVTNKFNDVAQIIKALAKPGSQDLSKNALIQPAISGAQFTAGLSGIGKEETKSILNNVIAPQPAYSSKLNQPISTPTTPTSDNIAKSIFNFVFNGDINDKDKLKSEIMSMLNRSSGLSILGIK